MKYWYTKLEDQMYKIWKGQDNHRNKETNSLYDNSF